MIAISNPIIKKKAKKNPKHANQTFNYHDCGKFYSDHLLRKKEKKQKKKQSVNQQKEMLLNFANNNNNIKFAIEYFLFYC